MKSSPQFKKVLNHLLPDSIINVIKKYHYLNTLRHFHVEDEPDLLQLENIIKKGDVVLDVGANIGIYMKFLSKFVGNTGEVWCLEPIPLTFEFLNFNIRKLGLKNIKLFNYAASENETNLIMEIPNVLGGENYYRAKIINENAINENRKYHVKSIPLDKLFDNFSRGITFIKIDVEGYEMSVIKGARKILSKFGPALLIEIGGDPSSENSSAFMTFEELRNLGYEPWINTDNKLTKWKPGDISINYFFLRKIQS